MTRAPDIESRGVLAPDRTEDGPALTSYASTYEILTAPGTSALAVVRLRGPDVADFLRRRFSRDVRPMRPTHGELRDDAGVIDDPVVVLADDGQSVDLTLHGSAWAVRATCDLAEREGFVAAKVEASTIDEEIAAALPRVKTELAARTLLAQRGAWQRMDGMCATGRGTPRPVEDDRPAAQVSEYRDLWHMDAFRAMLADRSLEHLLFPPTVAIVGLPNAGKSTLANVLFGTDRSIVSPVPGTTRDWVGELADLDGLVVTLVDTPGLRETDDAIERQAIEVGRRTIAAANAVVLLLDATRDDAAQREMVERFPDAVVAANKWDARIAGWDEPRLTTLDATPISAKAGDGIDALVAKVHARFDVGRRPVDAPRAWTGRQRRLVDEMLAGLDRPRMLGAGPP